MIEFPKGSTVVHKSNKHIKWIVVNSDNTLNIRCRRVNDFGDVVVADFQHIEIKMQVE